MIPTRLAKGGSYFHNANLFSYCGPCDWFETVIQRYQIFLGGSHGFRCNINFIRNNHYTQPKYDPALTIGCTDWIPAREREFWNICALGIRPIQRLLSSSSFVSHCFPSACKFHGMFLWIIWPCTKNVRFPLGTEGTVGFRLNRFSPVVPALVLVQRFRFSPIVLLLV